MKKQWMVTTLILALFISCLFVPATSMAKTYSEGQTYTFKGKIKKTKYSIYQPDGSSKEHSAYTLVLDKKIKITRYEMDFSTKKLLIGNSKTLKKKNGKRVQIEGKIIFPNKYVEGIWLTDEKIITNKKKSNSSYQKTTYQSYADAIKKLPATAAFKSIYYAKAKLKSKFGKKQTLIVCDSGTTPDCTLTRLFVNKGKNIYKYGSFYGVIRNVSKDCNYLYVSGSGAFRSIYKYNKKKKKYIEIKTIQNSGETYEKKAEKMRTKYKCTVNVDYKDA